MLDQKPRNKRFLNKFQKIMPNVWFFLSWQCQTMSERLTALKIEGSRRNFLNLNTKDNLASIWWEAQIIFLTSPHRCVNQHTFSAGHNVTPSKRTELNSSCQGLVTAVTESTLFSLPPLLQHSSLKLFPALKKEKKIWHNAFWAPARSKNILPF